MGSLLVTYPTAHVSQYLPSKLGVVSTSYELQPPSKPGAMSYSPKMIGAHQPSCHGTASAQSAHIHRLRRLKHHIVDT